LKEFDPFLLFDEFRSTPEAGFPDHPHRGFETVSYLFTGSVRHEDFAGHKGQIDAGDLQWMTAGRGILHSELPYGNDECHGIQMWVNLPKKFKMVEPAYQELKDAQIPRSKRDGVEVKIIAGESMGIKSPVYTRTPTMFLDFKVEKGAKFRQAVPTGWNAFLIVLQGEGWFGPNGKRVLTKAHHTVVFDSKGDSIEFGNENSPLLRFVLAAGQPNNEPGMVKNVYFENIYPKQIAKISIKKKLSKFS
jgi:redox-sensitive bicupin YhaK (pirin superfamily)